MQIHIHKHTHTDTHMYILTLMQIVEKASASKRERECVSNTTFSIAMGRCAQLYAKIKEQYYRNTVNAQVSHANPELRYDFCFIQAWFEIIPKNNIKKLPQQRQAILKCISPI